jgi:WD40 repeat protein
MPLHARVIATLAQRIDSFDVSPDLRTIALATSGGAKLYDLHSYQFLRSLNNGELASSVAWLPDGSELAVGSTKDYGIPFFQGGDSNNSNKAHLTVWDTSTWKIVFQPEFGNEMVNQIFRDIAWSPDGRSLAFSMDIGGVQVLDGQTGQLISQQEDFAATVTGIAWSPDGSRLVATNDMAYGIRRWRVSDDQSVRLFDPRASAPITLAWSPDGKRIASGHYLGGVCLWTTETNKCDGFIQAHRTATFSLAWSPDGNQLATGGGVLRIWDAHTGKLVRAFGEESRYMFSRIEWPAVNGPIVSLETGFENPGDTVLRLWDLSSGSILAEFRGVQPEE